MMQSKWSRNSISKLRNSKKLYNSISNSSKLTLSMVWTYKRIFDEVRRQVREIALVNKFQLQKTKLIKAWMMSMLLNIIKVRRSLTRKMTIMIRVIKTIFISNFKILIWNLKSKLSMIRIIRIMRNINNIKMNSRTFKKYQLWSNN